MNAMLGTNTFLGIGMAEFFFEKEVGAIVSIGGIGGGRVVLVEVTHVQLFENIAMLVLLFSCSHRSGCQHC